MAFVVFLVEAKRLLDEGAVLEKILEIDLGRTDHVVALE